MRSELQRPKPEPIWAELDKMDDKTVERVQHKNGKKLTRSMAGELGFEPRLTESESAVLPLNYSPFK
jgi:hypothetical protein